MKFNFKIQDYQTDAVESIIKVFSGQPKHELVDYVRDLGHRVVSKKEAAQYAIQTSLDLGEAEEDLNNAGFRNAELHLDDKQLLTNINRVQSENNIKLSPSLIKTCDVPSLDIEMETGTGKTYVYVKTMFELNRQYGWSKFIIVVPSIAIREGVYKSMQMTEDHFMEHYGKKARFFVYNSARLNDLDTFSSDSGINVMIINTQAFAKSLKEGANNAESKIIYSKRDEFASRRPIDVIKANHPIVILDEPQKMGGSATQNGIRQCNPLFVLNYSATHAQHHNEVYVLDALDAYNKKLVKKIQVKGFEVANLKGTNRYIYVDSIILSDKSPRVRMEIDVKQASGIARKTKIFDLYDDLYVASKELEEYKNGYSIADIDYDRNTITFTNGETLSVGQIVGDMSESTMRRIQIRETIISHFEKEEILFHKGIKTLSLFFIDEVAKYRQYDEAGEPLLGEYGRIFEEEYLDILNTRLSLFEDEEYQKYLRGISASATHRGYFSIDKKGHACNSELKRGSDVSDDISAYDLILKNKERLLSFDEPTRFIFSHSALREGWDNPNVFQICTLKHSDSTTAKRQEVGRGLRIAVNKEGTRMDLQVLGEDEMHEFNKLTVIASESYGAFVSALQKETMEVLYERPTKATTDFFEGKQLKLSDGVYTIDKSDASMIFAYLKMNNYIDKDGKITETYHKAKEAKAFADMTLVGFEGEKVTAIHALVQSIFDEHALDGMIEDGKQPEVSIKLNDNFHRKEFQELWRRINHKYAYTVQFDSDELVKKCIAALNDHLVVSEVRYKLVIGEQHANIKSDQIESGTSFGNVLSSTNDFRNIPTCTTKYDVVGDVAKGAIITRKTASRILSGLDQNKQFMFATNPEEFIRNVVTEIKAQKSTMIVEHISYNQVEGEYDSSIFTVTKHAKGIHNAIAAKKHITDYVFTDGISDTNSTEQRFCRAMEEASEVEVYAKLPKGFNIPTPVGEYSPDWAVAFRDDLGVKHIYFIAETKGDIGSMQLRTIEIAKTSCAQKLFDSISPDKVIYRKVENYDQLWGVVKSE